MCVSVCVVCDVSDRVREEMHEFLVHDLHFCFIFVAFLLYIICIFPCQRIVAHFLYICW